MNRAGRLPHVLALIERVGGLERLIEIEVELVKTRPIPYALAERLALAPAADAGDYRHTKARKWGVPSLDPKDMTPAMRLVLQLLCHEGRTEREIAEITGFPYNSIRDLTKALRGLFNARNNAQLCSLAVVRGYVRTS